MTSSNELTNAVHVETPQDTRTLYIDYSVCIGCETCEYVCAFLYNKPRIVMMRTTDGEIVPLYCRQCRSPQCLKACPQEALTQDAEGVILLNAMRCRGCVGRPCLEACPFGGMLRTSEGTGVTKCDLCASRREHGMSPACADMCPCGAIHYSERKQIRAMATPAAKETQRRALAHLRREKQ